MPKYDDFDLDLKTQTVQGNVQQPDSSTPIITISIKYCSNPCTGTVCETTRATCTKY